MRRLIVMIVAGLCWGTAGGLVGAAAPVDTGTAVGVNPLASVQFNDTSRTLIVGSDVQVGDTVVTGPAGQVQLLFKDDTRLVVGPHSSLLVEEYLLRRDKSVAKFTVDALSGSFRFITGKSAKDAYLIKTPTGTIGVRGTAYDLHVSKTRTDAVLFEGSIWLCNLEQKCVELVDRCDVGSITSPKSFVVGKAVQARDHMRDLFRYVESQLPLLPDFRVDQAGKCLSNFEVQGLTSGGGGNSETTPRKD